MRAVMVVLSVVVWFIVVTAAADDPAPTSGTQPAASNARVTHLREVFIEGRSQRPVSYVLPRSSMRYRGDEVRRSFTREVHRSVTGAPF